ncbi:hypothetical protein [Spartinivicinus poritis]|uniref:Uncharacterized protein n=1 Tax=Spartinivicinus poritis TaxID=2994640 RepID=A0ABT5UJ62_9GAMM|nr:hypothetical protein [Spartinivicinus sp. A2-2]MDE1465463.1 hypothetical protein [Spartinivicinus sp. A2-2]
MFKRMELSTAIITVALLASSSSQAAVTKVICSDLTDLQNWSMAKHQDGTNVTINGKWYKTTVNGNSNITFSFFLTSQSSYDQLSQYCGANYVPQPMSVSNKHVFVTEDSSSQLVAQPGVLSGQFYNTNSIPPASINTFTISEPNPQIVDHLKIVPHIENTPSTRARVEFDTSIPQLRQRLNNDVRADWVPFDTSEGFALEE